MEWIKLAVLMLPYEKSVFMFGGSNTTANVDLDSQGAFPYIISIQTHCGLVLKAACKIFLM